MEKIEPHDGLRIFPDSFHSLIPARILVYIRHYSSSLDAFATVFIIEAMKMHRAATQALSRRYTR